MIQSLSELNNVEFDQTFSEINGDIVLINMKIGESILDEKLKLLKISKSTMENVEYVLHFSYRGKTKKAYLIRTFYALMIVGTLGKSVDWLNQVYRDIEGKLILDSINKNNPFHSPGIETQISQRI